MRKPKITLAYDEHCNRGVVSLRFDRDFAKFKNPFEDDFFDSTLLRLT
jgi:hypothetical protein